MSSPLFFRDFPDVPETDFGNRKHPSQNRNCQTIGSGVNPATRCTGCEGCPLDLNGRREYLRESFPDSTAPARPSLIHRILFAAQIAATMISTTESPAIHASIVIIL
jgi:hypothetical protein